MKFRSKILLSFICAILIPCLILVLIMYFGSVNIIREKTDQITQKNLNSIALVVQQRLEFVNELTTLISMNPAIQEVLSAKPTNDLSTNVKQIIALDHALDSYYISNYYASTGSPAVPVIYLINKPDFQKYDISEKVKDISEISDKKWYQQAHSKSSAIIVDAEENVVIITRHLYDLQYVETAEYVAMLTLTLDQSFFTQLLKTYRPTPDSKLVLIFNDNQGFLSTDQLSENELEAVQQTNTEAIANSKSSLFATSKVTLTNVNWQIASITNISEMYASQNYLTGIVSVLMSACFIVAIFVALLLSRAFAKPISALVKSMKSIDNGNINTNISYMKNDEFSYLIDQYQLMMHKIQNLIQDLYESEASKRKAELEKKDMQLKALQAQINPHFLYNTLDSINLYAIKYNVPKISQMIAALANFFRYSLSKGSNLITLEEEINHTRAYLELQHIRYGPKLNYQFNIPPELRQVRMVKLVLQPLVENSVLHGNKGPEERLDILICAKLLGETVVVSVIDNGNGADAAALEKMRLSAHNKSASSSGSFAINNVDQRLRHVFGPQWGLRYTDNSNGGLSAEIHLPAKNEEGTND